ncbi:hypothetical protein ACHAWF_012052 [Thalassiosira exigua]
MDLRAPLHDDLLGGVGAPPLIEKGTAPCAQRNGEKSTAIDGRIIHHLLCRLYVASETMGLGSESRFTGLVLFHRYVRHFHHLVQQRQQKRSQEQSTQERDQMKSHLGTVAAACLFLGCKQEEDPQRIRIRDVINLSHVLSFSSWDDEDDASAPLDLEGQEKLNSLRRVAKCRGPITIAEKPEPPPLDETYWAAKEQIVSTEQHVLRMIQFDTTVCHPHRCVLIIMETLGFGVGKSDINGKEGGNETQCNWLLTSERSETIILRAWRILNEASLDSRGVALQYPVLILSFAAITIAADGAPGGDNDDNGNSVALPKLWWRALDVSTKDIGVARESLQTVLQQ